MHLSRIQITSGFKSFGVASELKAQPLIQYDVLYNLLACSIKPIQGHWLENCLYVIRVQSSSIAKNYRCGDSGIPKRSTSSREFYWYIQVSNQQQEIWSSTINPIPPTSSWFFKLSQNLFIYFSLSFALFVSLRFGSRSFTSKNRHCRLSQGQNGRHGQDFGS